MNAVEPKGKRYQGDHAGKRRPGERSWGGRFYEVDGRMLPSVTTILGVIAKPALVGWAAKVERELAVNAACDLWEEAPMGDAKMNTMAFRDTLLKRMGKQKAHIKEMEKAAEIGSQAHRMIEWSIKTELGQDAGPVPQIETRALWAFQAYEEWRKSVEMTPIASERFIYHAGEGYAGTIDLLYAETTFGPAVLDFKTSKSLYPEAKLQVSAYGVALAHMRHLEATPNGLVVRLPKTETDPGFEVCRLTPEEMATHFQAFLYAKRVWAWQAAELFPEGMEMTPETVEVSS